MERDAIYEKAKEIKVALAKETGVSLEDVEKILDHLGLDGALEHRQYVGERAERYGLGHTLTHRLADVSLKNIRIAAGEINV